jgi:hypothetical protein
LKIFEKSLDKLPKLWYNKSVKRKRGKSKMTNKEIIDLIIAQWEEENADTWARYEIGC